MRKILDYLLKSFNLLNLILIAGILIFVQYLEQPKISVEPKYEITKNNTTTDDNENEILSKNKDNSINLDYILIAAENPFHPERIIPVEKKEIPPPPKPELVLYGVTIAEDFSIAYVEDKRTPLTTPGRGKRHMVLKKGDSIGGFTLKEIHPERIILVRGEEIMTVSLLDSSKPRDVVTSPPAPQKPVTPPPRPLRTINVPQPMLEE
jgi:hypothetical protein